MSADEDDDEISVDEGEKKFRLFGRVVLFLLINGPTTVLVTGLWVRVGARASAHAANNGSSWLKITFIVWLFGLIGSALAIFKK